MGSGGVLSRTLMVDFQLRAGSAGHNELCVFLSVPRLSLDLGDGRNVVSGLGVRPIRTGHSFFCHIDSSCI